MGKRAMQTSRKRVAKLVRVELERWRQQTLEAMRAEAERNAAFGTLRSSKDFPGEVWLTPTPRYGSRLQTVAIPPWMEPMRLNAGIELRHSMRVIEMVFEPVLMQMDVDGVRVRWCNWEFRYAR